MDKITLTKEDLGALIAASIITFNETTTISDIMNLGGINKAAALFGRQAVKNQELLQAIENEESEKES